MAQPSFRAAGTGSATNGSSNPTPGLPSGTALNDILFCLVIVGNGTATVTVSGYTEVSNVQGTNIRFYLFWKRAGSSESAPSITITNNGSGAYARVWGWRLCTTSGTPYEDATTTGETSSQTVASSTVTPTSGDRTVVCFWGVEDDNTITGHPPSGWADRGSFSSATGTDGRVTATEYTSNPAPNVDVNSVTIASISTTAEYWAQTTLCLIPATIDWTKDLSDSMTLSDSNSRTAAFAKSLTDAIALSDAITKAASKVLSDAVTLSDSCVAGLVYAKSLSDSITFSDARTAAVDKALADAIAFSDAVTKAASIFKADTITLLDAIAKETGKSLADGITFTDLAVKEVGKVLTNALTLADYIQTQLEQGGQSLEKSLSDAFTLADAIVKEAGKNLADTLTLSDAIAKLTGKALADTITFSDLCEAIKAIEKLLADSITLSDSMTKAVGKVLADSVTLADAITKAVSKPLADAITFADSCAASITLFKALADSIVFADTIAKATGKNLSDVLNWTDAQKFDVIKVLTDALTWMDAIDLSFVLNLTKDLSDALTFMDNVAKAGTNLHFDLSAERLQQLLGTLQANTAKATLAVQQALGTLRKD